MVRIIFAAIFLATVLSVCPADASRQGRPFAGIGLLVVRPSFMESKDAKGTIPVYEDPGIKRIAELKAASLPLPFDSIRPSPGDCVLVVRDKRGDWVKVAYDEADRLGWVRLNDFREYVPWRDFLKNRRAALLPKLRGAVYKLRTECSDTAEPVADMPPLRDFRIVELDGDWAKIRAAQSAEGYIRWKGEDGRILISPGDAAQ